MFKKSEHIDPLDGKKSRDFGSLVITYFITKTESRWQENQNE
jgi:hypothetical protein